MKRRAFLTTMGVGILATPLATHARQAGRIARVGYLGVGPDPSQTAALLAAGLRERGWVEGRNLTIEWRFAESTAQLHASAAALGRLNLDVLVVPSFGVATVARLEAKNIPIVITASGVDLVRTGLVTSLARPAGNITGCQVLQTDMFGKRLQLLKEAVPNLARVGRLGETVTLGADDFVHVELERAREEARAAAHSLGLRLHFYVATQPGDLPVLFDEMIKNGEQGVVVVGSPFMSSRRQQIIDLMARHRLAAMYGSKTYVLSGGLISYGWDDSVLVSRAASYVDKILRGAKAGDLPIEQPTKFELVINHKTAQALGLTIPASLLLQADQVIQ